MQRIFPGPPETVSVDEAYRAERGAHPDGRPWIELCMIVSLDGSTVLDGASGALGNATDRAVLSTLRSMADMVLVGAGTARVEGYGPPRTAGQRIAVVSNSGRVDVTSELFTSGAGLLVLPEDGPPSPVETVRAGIGRVDLAIAITHLPGAPQVVHVEGGPTLNGALADADLIDELNMTISPTLVGGDGPRLLHGAAAARRPMRITDVFTDGGLLFTRSVRA